MSVYYIIIRPDYHKNWDMATILNQVRAILWKNILISRRSKEYLRENISVIILGILIIVVERDSPNNFITPFYLSIAIFGYSRAVGLNWVTQKSTRQKQLQKIMGMKSVSYALGWIIYFIINGLLVCVIMMLIFRFGAITPNFHLKQGYDFSNIVILYVLFMISITGFVLVFATFFQNPKNAAQGIIFLQLFINFLYFFRLADTFKQSIILTRLAGIFPQIAFNFAMSSIGFESMGLKYSYLDGVISLLIGIIFYFTLAFYLDQVLPNQFGTNKRLLFFLDCFKNRRRQIADERVSLLSNINNYNVECETSATYQQIVKRLSLPLIYMKNVTKKFGQKQVVSDVTINYYPNQIFCLLGHNGAGKSTTINILTGILKAQVGNLTLQGMNYSDDMDQIRKNIGLCLQYNVLYDQLTVQEHLRFYCIAKGIPKHLLDNQIQSVINECNLEAQKKKLSKNLSGGNKRKLSLANSLIGKSKFIFLDEPSSGLDPNSRQSIWGILKAIRSPQRCIILTTHHLEQAEQLSQRIGIMSYGKLVIVGDSEYIKNKFNVGYHMVLSFPDKCQPQVILQAQQIVKNGFSNARQDEQTALNTIKYILPLSQLSTFAPTFDKLQKICSISLKMSSLQDSFVKLGQQQMNEGVLQQIAELDLPNVQCRYNFWKQYQAVFTRKKLTTFRSLPGIVSILLPCLFITFGLALACLIIKGTDTQSQAVKYYILSYFLVWSFIFNTSSYCGDLVLQRENKFKYLSHVMGLKKFPYWLANYTFDYLLFIAPFTIFIVELYVFGESAQFLRNVIGYLIPLLLLFGLSFISYSYMFSFMFQKSSTAFRLFPFFNLIFFYSIPQIIIILDPQSFLSKYIVPLVSPFMALSNAFLTKQINQYLPIENYNILFIFSAFIVQAALYLLGALFIENLRFRLKDRQNVDGYVEQFDGEEAQNNRNQIEAQVDENDEIVIRNLYKKYSNGYMAINNNSFSVAKGQIFGLLGPNGAGKSTTFNIITAALAKTSGSVKMLGFEVNRGIMEIFANVGVCPQYDSIYQNMTTEQHLNYFAWLKGLSKEEISRTLDYYYKILSLTSYVKVRAGHLSGGNKRKLVVSMAMLANPKIMFFDQPSSGVDPISRRYLWKSFSLAARERNSSMILTTHTMNQAQSLCSRIGILIKGSFVAVATLGGLKAKYGKGYRAIVKADNSHHQEVKGIVSNTFGQANVKVEDIGENSETIVFTIANKNFIYSQAFKTFEQKLFSKGLIKSYKINQSTLQEIFLLLSEMQPEPEQQEYKEPWQFCCWQCGANGCQCLM